MADVKLPGSTVKERLIEMAKDNYREWKKEMKQLKNDGYQTLGEWMESEKARFKYACYQFDPLWETYLEEQIRDEVEDDILRLNGFDVEDPDDGLIIVWDYVETVMEEIRPIPTASIEITGEAFVERF